MNRHAVDREQAHALPWGLGSETYFGFGTGQVHQLRGEADMLTGIKQSVEINSTELTSYFNCFGDYGSDAPVLCSRSLH